MDILFVDQFSDPGGAQWCLLDLLPAVQARGWSAHFALPGTGAMIDRVRSAGATVDPISCPSYSFGHKSLADIARFACNLPVMAKQIARLAGYYGARLIYANGPRVLPAAALAAHNRRRLLFHCHLLLKSAYAARLAGESIRLAQGEVVLACRLIGKPLWRYVQPDRCHVVYSGIEEIPVPPRQFRPEGPWRIGIVGRIAPQKGQAEFLRAARLLASRIPNCTFVVCGAPLFFDGAAERYYAGLREAVAGLPVEFIGWQDRVGSVLSNLDILVVPSVAEEAVPRVILEAFAAGIPVVAFPAGGIPEVLLHEKNGSLVVPQTPEALANTLAGLIQTPQRLRAAAEAGRIAWRQSYTLTRYQAEVTAVMERAVS